MEGASVVDESFSDGAPWNKIFNVHEHTSSTEHLGIFKSENKKISNEFLLL